MLSSMVLNYWIAQHNASLAFYLLPTCAWELLIVGLLAFACFRQTDDKSIAMSLLGTTAVGRLCAPSRLCGTCDYRCGRIHDRFRPNPCRNVYGRSVLGACLIIAAPTVCSANRFCCPDRYWWKLESSVTRCICGTGSFCPLPRLASILARGPRPARAAVPCTGLVDLSAHRETNPDTGPKSMGLVFSGLLCSSA